MRRFQAFMWGFIDRVLKGREFDGPEEEPHATIYAWGWKYGNVYVHQGKRSLNPFRSVLHIADRYRHGPHLTLRYVNAVGHGLVGHSPIANMDRPFWIYEPDEYGRKDWFNPGNLDRHTVDVLGWQHGNEFRTELRTYRWMLPKPSLLEQIKAVFL